MKKLLAVLSCVAASAATCCAEEYVYPYIVFTIGAGTTVVAVDQLEMTVSDGKLVARNAVGTQEFALSELTSMSFSKDGTSDVHALVMSDGRPAAPVHVVDMSGRSIPQAESRLLRRGVYAVRTQDGRTHKIMVR